MGLALEAENYCRMARNDPERGSGEGLLQSVCVSPGPDLMASKRWSWAGTGL